MNIQNLFLNSQILYISNVQNAVRLTLQYEEQHPDENNADDEDAEKDHTNWKMDLSLACWIG